jgi:hypothetical protein
VLASWCLTIKTPASVLEMALCPNARADSVTMATASSVLQTACGAAAHAWAQREGLAPPDWFEVADGMGDVFRSLVDGRTHWVEPDERLVCLVDDQAQAVFRGDRAEILWLLHHAHYALFTTPLQRNAARVLRLEPTPADARHVPETALTMAPGGGVA